MSEPSSASRPVEDEGSFRFMEQDVADAPAADDKVAGGQGAAQRDLAEQEPEVLEAPDRGSVEELLDAGAHDALDAMRHSTAHVMAESVLALFPDAKLGIGPAIADGFYYDFELPRALTPKDLEA